MQKSTNLCILMPILLFILFSGGDYFTCQKTSHFDSTSNILGWLYLCDNWIVLFDKGLDLLRVSNKCTMSCTGCCHMVVCTLVLNRNCFPRRCNFELNFLLNSCSASMWCQIHDLASPKYCYSQLTVKYFYLTIYYTFHNKFC